METLNNISDKIITVNGKFGSNEIYLNLLKASLQKTDMNYTLFPSALDKNSTDAIYISSTKTSIILTESSEASIDTMEFLDKDALFREKDTLIVYNRIKEYFLEKARENLVKASDMHFQLEEIYTSAMDFLLINEYADQIIEKCAKVLE